MKTDCEGEEHLDESVVCPKCLLNNSPMAAFCVDCGAPIGMVSNIDPIQHIHSEGFAYRSAVDGPPRLIIVIGMWLVFVPLAIGVPFVALQALSASFIGGVFLLLFAAASIVLLYRATKNYVLKSRAIVGRSM